LALFLAAATAVAVAASSALAQNDGLPAATGGKPKAVIVDPEFDFGTVWVGKDIILRHSFVLKNEGDADLRILATKTSCGCTAVGDHPDVLKPGESCNIPFEMESWRLVGPEGGRFAKSAAVVTNDREHSHAEVLLTGYGRFHVQFPAAVHFGALREDSAVEKIESIINNTEQPMVLTLRDAPAAGEGPFTFELIQKEPGRAYELKVVTTPPLGEGRVAAEVLIETNVLQQPELRIPVFGTVPQRLEVRPPFLMFNERRLTVPVSLTNNGARPVKVTSVVSDDPSLTVEVQDDDPGRRYTINVTFPRNYVSARGERRLVISTDDAAVPRIEIPIRPPTQSHRKHPAEDLVGQPAPPFEFTTQDGITVNNQMLYSHDAVVLTFWAADCPYSKKALPRLEKVREAYADRNVRFINVTQTMRRRYTDDQVKTVADALGMRAELVMDQDNRLGPRFKADSFPTVIVLGRSGDVERVSVGNTASLEQDIGGRLKELTDPD